MQGNGGSPRKILVSGAPVPLPEMIQNDCLIIAGSQHKPAIDIKGKSMGHDVQRFAVRVLNFVPAIEVRQLVELSYFLLIPCLQSAKKALKDLPESRKQVDSVSVDIDHLVQYFFAYFATCDTMDPEVAKMTASFIKCVRNLQCISLLIFRQGFI